MKRYRVVLAPEALSHLRDLRDYIGAQNSRAIADGFVDRIIDHCRKLETFPRRGTMRDDLRPGVRTMPFDKRTTICFDVDRDIVTILKVAYGGRDLAQFFVEG